MLLWIRDVTADDDAVALTRGFAPYRDLWQMRCDLPAAEHAQLKTRPFREEDTEEFVTMNNRAFRCHPEQGKLTIEKMRTLTAEPWFDADGFLLHHHKGRLTGFCWTKIHTETSPPLGEVYVIAVDSDFTCAGLGRAIALTGLDWLSAQGLRTGMLYVDSENRRARAIYRRIGFLYHHTNRAYWRFPAHPSNRTSSQRQR